MKDFLLEACVDSTASAEAAHRGGADRLELCSGLVVGGLTPGLSFFRQVKERTGMRVHVLIRPRFGDFCYSEENAVIEEDVKAFVEAGVMELSWDFCSRMGI
ncbi:MAG: copper homeostasis protein CutC [Anaeromassilibacillus sp.]